MSAWASKTVNGKVVSAVDNEPLIGATIQAVGSSQGTATDINGEFTVTVNDNVTQLTSVAWVTRPRLFRLPLMLR